MSLENGKVSEKRDTPEHSSYHMEDVDLSLLHEARAGRLVVDPEEAKIEFGELLIYSC